MLVVTVLLVAGMTKFNLKFYFQNCTLVNKDITFQDCSTIQDVRKWLNESEKFINLGKNIINTDEIQFINIKESKGDTEEDWEPPRRKL